MLVSGSNFCSLFQFLFPFFLFLLFFFLFVPLSLMASSSSSSSAWIESHRAAKAIEARLEAAVQRYASIAQKINADFLCDEENPLLLSTEEQSLASQIEHDLVDFHEAIVSMREAINNPLSPSLSSSSSSYSHKMQSPASTHQQEMTVKRFSEIHYDYSSEFRNTHVRT